jgi:predicted house-cleaning noncanonical NTP pyrophosphatase (MazG superfamily)
MKDHKIKTIKHNKLVRDKIPEIIIQNGHHPKYHIAKTKEFKQKLHAKLLEEVTEFLEDTNEEELADVREVLDAISKLHDLDQKKSKKIQQTKAQKRGRFNKRIILDSTN